MIRFLNVLKSTQATPKGENASCGRGRLPRGLAGVSFRLHWVPFTPSAVLLNGIPRNKVVCGCVALIERRGRLQAMTSSPNGGRAMRTMISLVVVATMIGGPAALAENTTKPNSGAGVPGLSGNKSGPPAKPGEQSNVRPDQSNVPGLPGNKSGPPAQKAPQGQKSQ